MPFTDEDISYINKFFTNVEDVEVELDKYLIPDIIGVINLFIIGEKVTIDWCKQKSSGIRIHDKETCKITEIYHYFNHVSKRTIQDNFDKHSFLCYRCLKMDNFNWVISVRYKNNFILIGY